LAMAAFAAIGAFIGAYFGERGKIKAQTAAIEDVVRLETAKSASQEQGKNLARKEDLEQILTEVRAVTGQLKRLKRRFR